MQRSPVGTREAPASREERLKQESREGQAWPARVAERPVVVKTRVTSAEQRGLSSKATQPVGPERRLARAYNLPISSGNYKKRCMPKRREYLPVCESMKSPWSESRMRENHTSGLMSGGVETGPLKDTAPPLDSTYQRTRQPPNLLLPACACYHQKEGARLRVKLSPTENRSIHCDGSSTARRRTRGSFVYPPCLTA